MASMMVYLGYTGENYRVALVDTENMPSVRVPVKDCPTLPEIPLLNCTVVNGTPIVKAVNKWDGLCKEGNWYILGRLVLPKDVPQTNVVYSVVCINHEGYVAVFKLKDISLLNKELNFVVESLALCANTKISFCIYDYEYCCREIAGRILKTQIKAVWFNDLKNERSMQIRDLRKYSKAEVFGLYIDPNAKIYIFPESAKIIWLGFTRDTSSVKAIYLPKGVESLPTALVSKRKFKDVTFYSASPKVYAFSKQVGAKFVYCTSVEDMLVSENLNPAARVVAVTKPVKNFTIATNDFVPTSSEERLVHSVLAKIGIPSNLLGCRYLRECILTVLSDMSLIHSITRKVYPILAQKYNTTPSSVERAIQHAIGAAWRCNAAEELNKYFGCNVASPDKRPTNCEFIALIADKLQLELAKHSTNVY